jgi:3-hydroxyisobutyrate dehydrogenase
MKIAFLGLGDIGKPMAHHIAKSKHELTVWNRSADKAAEFVSEHRGVIHAPTPAEAVKEADVVITCLPSSVEVEELLHRPDGMLASLRSGSILLDCTSGDPAASRDIAAELAPRKVEFVDAPVSGGTIAAVEARLTVMCGGTPEAFARVKPVIEIFGKKIVYCGPVGAGHTVKAVNQALLAVHILATAEALVAAAKAGVNPAVALEVINASSGRSNSSENLIPSRALTREFPRTFRLALLDKDVDIAARLARDVGLDAPLIELAARLTHEAHQLLGEEVDHVEAVRLVEKHGGAEIRDTGKK